MGGNWKYSNWGKRGGGMRIDRILAGRAAEADSTACHHRTLLSRRRFMQSAAGAAVLGAAATKGLLSADLAGAAPGIGQVLPIPTTLELFPGHHFHLQAPPFTGEDSDPATVTNFEGTSGLAYISGSCVRVDRKTGESRTLPFSFNDMRFMQGVFRGRDGHARNATFAFT
ncbi:MAG: hypothetical protein QOC92_3051 [Acidimicrobiaceae bacterium]